MMSPEANFFIMLDDLLDAQDKASMAQANAALCNTAVDHAMRRKREAELDAARDAFSKAYGPKVANLEQFNKVFGPDV